MTLGGINDYRLKFSLDFLKKQGIDFMIGISNLYCGEENPGDAIRYGHNSSKLKAQPMAHLVPKTASERRPVVAWNITRTCNLKCIHCYTDSEPQNYGGELSNSEAKEMMKDLAEFGIPALLFSGGEPTMREDLFDLVKFARSLGIRPTLSTNGTLITKEMAQTIKASEFSYVGVSLDGIGEINDRFRGMKGAFERTMTGFRNLKEVGQRVGLRLTLTRENYKNLHQIFDFIEAEGIERACFYHLVYAGRGSTIEESQELTHKETRNALDIIIERTEDLHKRGIPKDILTVDNHVDGIFLYLKLLKTNPERAKQVLELLEWNGGGTYSSGVGFGDIDFRGNVHADQFWMHYSFGNIKERKFSEIWMDTSDALMNSLKNRKNSVKGKCQRCKFFKACGGSMRVRADLVYGDPSAPDPMCYLTNEETGITEKDMRELKEATERKF